MSASSDFDIIKRGMISVIILSIKKTKKVEYTTTDRGFFPGETSSRNNFLIFKFISYIFFRLIYLKYNSSPLFNI